MIVNTAQGGGGSLPLNLFVQPDEPAVKEGLWIQAPAKETLKRVVNKSSFVIGGTFVDSGVLFATRSMEGWFYIKRGNYIYYLNYFVANGDSSGSLIFYINRYDITTKTTTSATLFSTNYSQGLSKDLCYFYIKDDTTLVFYLSYHYGNGNYPIVCGTLNLSDFHTVTTTSSSGLPISSLNSAMVYLGEDDTNVYFLYRYSNSSYYGISLDAIAKATGTGCVLKELYTPSDQLTYAGVWGILVEGIVYYVLQSSTVLHMLNISDLTETTVTMPTTVFVNSEYLRWAVYQNSLYMPAASGNAILVFDLVTKTFSQITASNPPVTQELLALFEDTDNKRLLCAFVAGNELFYYNFESESLPENTLAVLDGTKYNVKLISSANMDFLRTVFNDAWWYDTDFKEYPTYIGNGTSFTKIKN